MTNKANAAPRAHLPWDLHPALTEERITACARLLARGRTDALAMADSWAGDDALQVSAQEVVLGQRRRFSEHSQALIIRAVAGEPFAGRCSCCTSAPVLTKEGRRVAGAEFDHFFHRGL